MSSGELAQALRAQMGAVPQSLADLARSVGRRPSDGSVRRALDGLVAEGVVARDGNRYFVVPDRANSGTFGIPEPSAALGVAGRAAWVEAWSVEWTHGPDMAGISHLCRLEDEAARMIALIEREGPVQHEPIVAPRGDVVGARLVAHPMISELRKLDAQLMVIRASLGLSPASRARLGVTLYGGRPDGVDELQEKRRKRREQVRPWEKIERNGATS